MNTTWSPCLVELQTICSSESLLPSFYRHSLMGWKGGHGLCTPQLPLGSSAHPPPPSDRMTWETPRSFHREDTGAPALGTGSSLLLLLHCCQWRKNRKRSSCLSSFYLLSISFRGHPGKPVLFTGATES